MLQIDIGPSDNCYILKGDITSLKSNRSAFLFLKDYLNADFTNAGFIKIPFEVETKESVWQGVQKIIMKNQLEIAFSKNIETLLSDFIREEDNFKNFSQQANSIRNNELDSIHVCQFKEFTNQLLNNVPKRRLYSLQLLSAYHLAFSQHACNFSVPGSGKTSVVYGAYAYLKNLPEHDPKKIDRLLIIGPLSSFGPWETEYEECFGDKPSSKRLAGGISKLDRNNYFYSGNPSELTLISYRGVSNMLDDLVVFLKKYRVMIVLDEAHNIKNTEGGVNATSVLQIAKYCKSRVVLTGTPAPNGYEDIYNLFNFIWPTKKVIRYHLSQLKDMSTNFKDPRISNLIQDVSPYFIRVKKSDLNLPLPISNPPIIVEMGEIQREIYDYIENSYLEYFMKKEENQNRKDLFAQARLIRLMQASTNPALLQEPVDSYFMEAGISNDTFIDDSGILEKIIDYKNLEIPQKFIYGAELIKKIISRGDKVVVWATFIKNILGFQEYLASVGISSKTLYGATPIERDDTEGDIETRESIIKEFHKSDSSFSVIIANPFAVGESISLHKACKNAIYLERTFNAAHFIQSKDRIHRYGLKPEDKINYYYLLSDNTTDRTIHERLEYKEGRMMKIIESEPIPLFSRLDADDTDDIKALIKNYVNQVPRV